MNIDIKKSDFEILNKYLPPVLMKELSYVTLNDKRYLISIGRENALEIIDALTMVFTEIGLNNDSEPNEIGLQIEGVIDVFSEVGYSDEE